MDILMRLFWHLGITASPSRYFVDGHGYSWLGKKIRRKKDIDWHTVLVTGVAEDVQKWTRHLDTQPDMYGTAYSKEALEDMAKQINRHRGV